MPTDLPTRLAEARAGFTYRIFEDGKEVECLHCIRVHGRRIEFGLTAYSSLTMRSTRLRWRKLLEKIAAEPSLTITEEPSGELEICRI